LVVRNQHDELAADANAEKHAIGRAATVMSIPKSGARRTLGLMVTAEQGILSMRTTCWRPLLPSLVMFIGCSSSVEEPPTPRSQTVALAPSAKTTKSAAAEERKAVPSGLSFVVPDGFEERPEHKLFYHPKLHATISPAYAEGANFEQLASEFTADRLREIGMILKERAMKEVGGQQRLFVKCDRLDGKTPKISVTVAFRTPKGCAQLSAMYPKATSAEIQATIESAILNAQYSE
jgi:hypothetical protein